MRVLRVLLATLIAVPLLGYSASSLAMAWVLRDVERPVPRSEPLTLAHRGLACLRPSSAQVIAAQRRAFLGPGTFTRIVQEWALRAWLERRYDDDQLARLQADTVWLGRGAYGVEAGARVWFDRPLSELTTAQTALLVGLAQYPSRLDPRRNAEKARRRRQAVLGAWQTCGLIPPGSALTMESKPVLEGVVGSTGQEQAGIPSP